MKFFSKTMKLNNIDTVPYLTYNSLSEISFINHAFTTRLGGGSRIYINEYGIQQR